METVTPPVLAEEVRRGIAALADPAKAPAMQAYMRSAMPYRGVTAVPLGRLLKETFGRLRLASEDDWHTTILLLWDDAQWREERYAATTLAGHRDYAEHRQPHTMELYRHLVVTGAWWDHVDVVATRLVRSLLDRHADAVTPFVLDWSTEDDLWLRRSAIISQVGRGASLDRDLLVTSIDANLDGSTRTTPPESPYGREFFVRKAIGWALRDHARTDPAWVAGFLAERGDRLSGLSRREAAKHLTSGSLASAELAHDP